MLHLQSGETELSLDPSRGGGIIAFRWRGIDVFRPDQNRESPVNLANFPLVPFCNRIAHGSFRFAGKPYSVPVCDLGIENDHALHGIGWTNAWRTDEASKTKAKLVLEHDGECWPWKFESQQSFTLIDNGYVHQLSLTNRAEHSMPAGLGLHPFFPRAGAELKLDSNSMWKAGADRLPTQKVALQSPPDWFEEPALDACFSSSTGAFSIHWPSHHLRVTPSSQLSFTHVYTPVDEGFFCVEPVSHIPDAVNSELPHNETGLAILEPGETMKVECRFEVEEPR